MRHEPARDGTAPAIRFVGLEITLFRTLAGVLASPGISPAVHSNDRSQSSACFKESVRKHTYGCPMVNTYQERGSRSTRGLVLEVPAGGFREPAVIACVRGGRTDVRSSQRALRHGSTSLCQPS